MSDLEIFAGFIAVGTMFWFWASWYTNLIRINPLASIRRERIVLALAPAFCAGLLLVVLLRFAATDVRPSPFWISYYLLLGAAWMALSINLSVFLGISMRDDVLERRNSAALWVILATLASFTICFAGGNIGEGPGAEAVLASAGLATVVQFALWGAVEFIGQHPSERITIDRDVETAIRLGGMLLGNSLILGYAASGNWDPDNLVPSFANAAWPAVVLTACAILVERRASSLHRASRFLAVLYVVAGASVVWMKVAGK